LPQLNNILFNKENVQNSKIFFQDLYDWAIENCKTIPADGNLANEHENFKELFDLSTDN
jgi:hypothetical protein